MSGIEALHEEMYKRGCTKTQVDAKVVGIVLSIIANNNIYIDIQDAQNTLSTLQKEINDAKEKIGDAKNDYNSLCDRYNSLCREIRLKKNEFNKEVAAFNESLFNSETAEGRDSLRKAQVFIQNTHIDTKYDNTAYIAALGAILSNNKFDVVTEMKKINPKVYKQETYPGVLRV